MSADHAKINTAFLLMAQYGPRAVIPLADVQRDYFSRLEVEHLQRKINNGDIRIPVISIEDSKKSAKGISTFRIWRTIWTSVAQRPSRS
jgi:hypothetical protein